MKFSKKIIILILILINIFIFYKLNQNKFSFKYLFKPTCSINKIEDIEYCYKTNSNVKIDIKNIYETGYTYIDNNYILADIDINDRTLIGIIKRENINKKQLYGYLEKPDKITRKIIEKIKIEYNEKMDIEDIDKLFIPLVFNSYKYYNSNIYNIIYMFLFITTVVLIIYFSYKIVKEEKYEK